MERKALKKGFILLLVSCMTIACERKEIPATPYDRGSAKSVVIKMGENYSEQIYYSLGENKVVKQNSKMDWDFALSCDDLPVIKLNTSRNMLAGVTQYSDLKQVTDTQGLRLEMDFPGGDKDSLSIGRLNRLSKVFVVWMGYGLNGEDLGLIKIKFDSVAPDEVQFEYGKITDQVFYRGSLKTDDRYNHVFWSMKYHHKADIEPLKTDYDLWFTQYLHFFLEPEVTPYLVAGALLNPHRIEASKVIKNNLSEVNLADTNDFPLRSNPDVIGYDWKRFSLSENTYTIIPNFNYIIRTREGFYYRLKFTDFYDENGFRGAPGFIFELI